MKETTEFFTENRKAIITIAIIVVLVLIILAAIIALPRSGYTFTGHYRNAGFDLFGGYHRIYR